MNERVNEYNLRQQTINPPVSPPYPHAFSIRRSFHPPTSPDPSSLFAGTFVPRSSTIVHRPPVMTCARAIHLVTNDVSMIPVCCLETTFAGTMISTGLRFSDNFTDFFFFFFLG